MVSERRRQDQRSCHNGRLNTIKTPSGLYARCTWCTRCRWSRGVLNVGGARGLRVHLVAWCTWRLWCTSYILFHLLHFGAEDRVWLLLVLGGLGQVFGESLVASEFAAVGHCVCSVGLTCLSGIPCRIRGVLGIVVILFSSIRFPPNLKYDPDYCP